MKAEVIMLSMSQNIYNGDVEHTTHLEVISNPYQSSHHPIIRMYQEVDESAYREYELTKGQAIALVGVLIEAYDLQK